MNLVDRAKNILFQPNQEWPVIAAEVADTKSLFAAYAMPLASIGPIALWLGLSVIGVSVGILGTYRTPIIGGLGFAILTYVLGLVSVFVLGLIVDALAPSFGGEKNNIQAMKCAVYAHTPAWLGGIFHLLPALGVLALVTALYGLYLLYLGLPVLMKAPKDKAVGYTVVVVLCAIVLTIVVSVIGSIVGFGGAGMRGAGLFGDGADSVSKPAPGSVLGKLDTLSKKMEESGKVDGRLVIEKVDRKSGDAEYGVVLADRFAVNTSSTGVDPRTLHAMIARLDLGKLEAMRDIGVQK